MSVTGIIHESIAVAPGFTTHRKVRAVFALMISAGRVESLFVPSSLRQSVEDFFFKKEKVHVCIHM